MSQLRGYYTHIPWTGGTHADAAAQGRAGTTIPLFNYSLTASKDGLQYSGSMVGTSPFVTPLTGTTISAVVVPLKITIGRSVFDPTAANSCDGNVSTVTRFVNSPLVQNAPNLTFNGVNVGTTQYVNGFRRAEFFNAIGGSTAYQNTLSPVVIAAAVSLTAGRHGTLFSSGCSQLGIISINWLDNLLVTSVIPSLTASGVLSPTKVAFFLLRNVVQSNVDPPSVNQCCILGYHSATGNPVQTYSPMDWDTTGDFGAGTQDGSIASHEIGEWMDDPLGNNATPAWGNIGQVSGCQGNYEVGDPLSGILAPPIPLNGKTYHMQELAFFSWFFNAPGDPSLGAGGKYSSNGTFTGPSKLCPPGGTN